MTTPRLPLPKGLGTVVLVLCATVVCDKHTQVWISHTKSRCQKNLKFKCKREGKEQKAPVLYRDYVSLNTVSCWHYLNWENIRYQKWHPAYFYTVYINRVAITSFALNSCQQLHIWRISIVLLLFNAFVSDTAASLIFRQSRCLSEQKCPLCNIQHQWSCNIHFVANVNMNV